ncbi:hypothetical protein Tco_0567378 [Tanacetum coccineum]
MPFKNKATIDYSNTSNSNFMRFCFLLYLENENGMICSKIRVLFQGIVPTVTLFRVFQSLCKQGDWFSFAKRHNSEDVCMDDGPSSMKKWKKKFFLLDPRAILDYLTWRHSHSCVADDLPLDALSGPTRIVIRFSEGRMITLMSIYDFMTLPSWGDAKIVEEANQLPTSILKRVLRNTSDPVAEGALVPVPTPNEDTAAQPNHLLAKKSKILMKQKAPSSLVMPFEPFQSYRRRMLRKKTSEVGYSAPVVEQSEGVDNADMADFCTKLEDSIERDEGTSVRVASAPSLQISKRLGSPHRLPATTSSEPLHVSASDVVRASSSGHGLVRKGSAATGFSRKGGAEYDQIPDDDFGTASRGDEIDLLFFPLAPGPYVMPYLFEGESPPEYTKCSSCFGAEMNSHYANLVASKARYWEKLNRKSERITELDVEVSSLHGKYGKAQEDCRALDKEYVELRSRNDAISKELEELRVQFTGVVDAATKSSDELALTDAKLSDQALVLRDLQNKLGLERSKSQEYKDAAANAEERFNRLKGEVTDFVGSSIESLVRRRTHGRTDVGFEEATRNVSNFFVGDKAEFNKAVVDLPFIEFPFLAKIAEASEGSLPEIANIQPDKLHRPTAPASATSVAVTKTFGWTSALEGSELPGSSPDVSSS